MIRTIHVLGIKKTDFKPIEMGAETFETRKNDRDFHRGEFIKFVVIPDDLGGPPYIVDDLYEVIYVMNGLGLKDGRYDPYTELGIRRRARQKTIRHMR